MQIVSLGDSLHEMSKSILWKIYIKKNINLSSAEFAYLLSIFQRKYKAVHFIYIASQAEGFTQNTKSYFL